LNADDGVSSDEGEEASDSFKNFKKLATSLIDSNFNIINSSDCCCAKALLESFELKLFIAAVSNLGFSLSFLPEISAS
jgi:hypothetical protein